MVELQFKKTKKELISEVLKLRPNDYTHKQLKQWTRTALQNAIDTFGGGADPGAIQSAKNRLQQVIRSLVIILNHVPGDARTGDLARLEGLASVLEGIVAGQGPVFGALPRERDWIDDLIRQRILDQLDDSDTRWGLLEIITDDERWVGAEVEDAEDEEMQPLQDRIDEALGSVVDYVEIAV